MLQVFYMDVAKVDSDVAFVAMAIHGVAGVCSKRFICFRRILQVFYLDVAYIASVCFKYFYCFRRMLKQVFHVPSVS
jgi:uncharacterized integral membrane protein